MIFDFTDDFYFKEKDLELIRKIYYTFWTKRYKVLGLTQNELEDHYKQHKRMAAQIFRDETDPSNQSQMDEKLGILNTLLDQV